MWKFINDDEQNTEIQEIMSAIKNTRDLRIHKRYMVILRHLEGVSNSEIARLECITSNTVRNYIKAYTENKLEGLIMGIVQVHLENLQKNMKKY